MKKLYALLAVLLLVLTACGRKDQTQNVSVSDVCCPYEIVHEEDAIVISAVFQLTPKPAEEIRAVMQDLMNRRKTSQPLDKPSAGSAFKRPVSGYAAALIDQTGLKGYRVGDAAVSEKHAGFVVNLGAATAKDVQSLLADVAKKVFDATGIQLEPEVRIW